MYLAIFVGLATGAIIGTLNGLIITKINIPFFIVTLSMMTLVRGVGYLITGGLPIAYLGDDFAKIGKGLFLGLPIPFWIIVVVFAILYAALNYTKFGRYVYAIGGNTEAVRLVGHQCQALYDHNIYALRCARGTCGYRACFSSQQWPTYQPAKVGRWMQSPQQSSAEPSSPAARAKYR